MPILTHIPAPSRDSAIAYALAHANNGLDVFNRAICAAAIKGTDIQESPDCITSFSFWHVSIAIIQDGREIMRQRRQVWNEPSRTLS